MNHRARIFISVAEDSADVHAAALVRAARERLPGVEFYGLTGPRLRELGVQTVFDFASHAAMLAGVLGVLRRAYRAVQAVECSWRQCRPDLVVLIDSPELHLRLARKARQLGIPVLYYIAPQTWASREYRNRQIVRDIDRLACILPFEEEYFARAANPSPKRERGSGASTGAARVVAAGASPAVEAQESTRSSTSGEAPDATRAQTHFRAEYVGHPLFETLRQERPNAETVEFLRARAADRPIVAILPGSRRHVIGTMLPMQLEVVRRMRASGQDVYAAISCVSEERREQIRDIVARHTLHPLHATRGLYQARASSFAELERPAGATALEQCGAGPLPLVRDSDLAPDAAGIPSRTVLDANSAASGAEKGFSAQRETAGTEPGRYNKTSGEAPDATGSCDAGIDVVIADNASLLTAADLVLVASGTATLHVAYYRKPMIVMYDAGWLLHWPYRLLGRFVIKTPHLSLVNVLAQARVVPEFVPFIRDLAAIATVADQLLTDKTWRDLMVRQLDEVVRPLEESQASVRVCEIMRELLAARCRA